MISADNTPTALRQIVEQILSPEELTRFTELDRIYHNSVAVEDDPIGLHVDENKVEWKNLTRKVNERAKDELCLASYVTVLGWLEGGSDCEATLLDSDVICNGEYFVAESEIRSANGDRYLKCISIQADSPWFDDVMLSGNGTWLIRNEGTFTAQGRPVLRILAATEEPDKRKEAPLTPERGSPGRPRTPNLEAAKREALRRVQKGGTKKVVAIEVAEEFGVNANTLRDSLKPSRHQKQTNT